ncbi:hypothetical protein A1OE_283 [Candidatus Endolissoclinum faulkneri L2]|uniref:Uncharacterized protein n=1 Tax=Candidatus Endolissoclinum faulkneri L2 TaxID=1193729 RepID=K7Z3E5_9PROT|nr:hypothetical protein A1OE_283 [Candidatus Endolissoclinum faulkneri L2]
MLGYFYLFIHLINKFYIYYEHIKNMAYRIHRRCNIIKYKLFSTLII